jgi:hypothetical protein
MATQSKQSPKGENSPDLGPIFRTFISGENFGENSAENFPPKMSGKN